MKYVILMADNTVLGRYNTRRHAERDFNVWPLAKAIIPFAR